MACLPVITMIIMFTRASRARGVQGKSYIARQACSEHLDDDGRGSNVEC